jgi:hypothetical protein
MGRVYNGKWKMENGKEAAKWTIENGQWITS